MRDHSDLQMMNERSLAQQSAVRRATFSPAETKTLRAFSIWEISTFMFDVAADTLRKKLAEFDATGGDTRLVVSRDDIANHMRLFLPDTANEARLFDRMETHLNKVVELGFLRRLRGQGEQYEVRRILKAFVDAQWLDDFAARLDGYAQHAAAIDDGEGA